MSVSSTEENVSTLRNTITILPTGQPDLPVESEETIIEDAKYALQVANSYINRLPEGKESLKNKSVLELGAGKNLGTALILISWGARQVTVCDRFLFQFRKDYHVRVYKEILRFLEEAGDIVNINALQTCIEGEEHITAELRYEQIALEDLANKYQNEFDISLSNAVLEHLYNSLRALQSLYSSMKKGGIGHHQVDFRDHRDFSKPLEYLLLDEFSFHELMTKCRCSCGNRLRPHQMLAMFTQSGFKNVAFEVNMWAEPDYIAEFVLRLRQARISSYSDMDPRFLQDISGMFKIKKW